MGAPKGNKNGSDTRFQPLTTEQTRMVGTRLPLSEAEQLARAIASSGKTKAEWIREAISQKIQKEVA
jgi:predicted DNA-binding protein